MMEDTGLKIRLTKTVRDFGGSPFPKGSVLKARIARDGMLEVLGAQHLPLYPHEWELVLTDEELERFVGCAQEGRAEVRQIELYANGTWTEHYGDCYVAEAIAWSENGNHATIYAVGSTAEEAHARLIGALRELELIPEASMKDEQ